MSSLTSSSVVGCLAATNTPFEAQAAGDRVNAEASHENADVVMAYPLSLSVARQLALFFATGSS